MRDALTIMVSPDIRVGGLGGRGIDGDVDDGSGITMLKSRGDFTDDKS